MGSCARAACGAASSAGAAMIDGRVRARLIVSPVRGGIRTAIMETARLDGKAAALAPTPTEAAGRISRGCRLVPLILHTERRWTAERTGGGGSGALPYCYADDLAWAPSPRPNGRNRGLETKRGPRGGVLLRASRRS